MSLNNIILFDIYFGEMANKLEYVVCFANCDRLFNRVI